MQHLTPQNEQLYVTTVIPNPGGLYSRIANSVIEQLGEISRDTLVIVYIIGGLCDVTEKKIQCWGLLNIS